MAVGIEQSPALRCGSQLESGVCPEVVHHRGHPPADRPHAPSQVSRDRLVLEAAREQRQQLPVLGDVANGFPGIGRASSQA